MAGKNEKRRLDELKMLLLHLLSLLMMNTAMLSQDRTAKKQGNQDKKQPLHGIHFETTSSAKLFSL